MLPSPSSSLPLSHITIRDLESLEEFQACVAFQEETWGQGFSERVPGAILHVGQEIGGVTAGAFDEHGTMVGFESSASPACAAASSSTGPTCSRDRVRGDG